MKATKADLKKFLGVSSVTISNALVGGIYVLEDYKGKKVKRYYFRVVLEYLPESVGREAGYYLGYNMRAYSNNQGYPPHIFTNYVKTKDFRKTWALTRRGFRKENEEKEGCKDES